MGAHKIAFLAISLAAVTGCGNLNHMAPSPAGEPDGGTVSGASPAALTYEGQIQALFQKRCGACHNASSPGTQPNWQDYDTAFRFKDQIYQYVVVSKIMPKPPYDTEMTDAERQMVGAWVQAGAPKGSGNSGTGPMPPTGGPGNFPAPGQNPVPGPEGPPATVTYLGTFGDDVQPIFERRCAQCHKQGRSGVENNFRRYPKDWTDYANAFQFKDTIAQFVSADFSMPPENLTGMTNKERSIVAQWAMAGGSDVIPFTIRQDWLGATTIAGNGCLGGPGSAPVAQMTYTRCIKPIFQARCIPCHTAGEYFGVDALDYQSVFNQRGNIQSWVVDYQYMPLDNRTGMTQQERDLVSRWYNSGAQDDPAPAPEPSAPPPQQGLTYHSDILPIIMNRCAQCHNPGSPQQTQPNWQDYATAFAFRAVIDARVYHQKSMPPMNATGITDAERRRIHDWIVTGAKER